MSHSSLWRYLITPSNRGAWNMAVDEAILEHVHRGDSLPTLRLYSWNPPCLSLGHAQPFSDVDLSRLQERGWDIVRRPTGGRAILHTDELTYSVMAPTDDPRTSGSLLESYNRIARALSCALKELGLPVEIKEHVHSLPVSAQNPVCFEVPSSYEITVQGRKLIGSAQARKKEGVLQHGSLPLYGNLARITEALVFTDRAARQQAATRVLDRAVTVESVIGRRVSWQEAAEAFVRAFQLELGLEFEQASLSSSEAARAEKLVQEKYAHSSWTERV